jgi:AraC-like DNA-binding protein
VDAPKAAFGAVNALKAAFAASGAAADVRATVEPVGYREHPVPPRWRGLAECVWTSTAPSAPEVIDVLPDGCMDLVCSGAELFVAGPDTAPHPFERRAGSAATGLRFLPGVLPALLDVPAAALRDARVPVDALHPGLGSRGVAALTAGAPAASVLTALAARLPGGGPEPGLHEAVRRLARGGSAAETADGLGWTTRTLHRRCLTAFGYGPSTLRRVLRFRRAVRLLQAGVAPAEVAARTGYADQPHLSRDIRAFAGVSPARLTPSHPE